MSFRNSKPVAYSATERKWNTDYINDTDHTIHVSISLNMEHAGGNGVNNKGGDLYLDDVLWQRALVSGGGYVWVTAPLTVSVPPGSKYRLNKGNTGVSYTWVEHRYKGIK